MKQFKGKLPANARINITYGKTDTVQFSYPRKWTFWKAVHEVAVPTVGLPCFMLFFICAGIEAIIVAGLFTILTLLGFTVQGHWQFLMFIVTVTLVIFFTIHMFICYGLPFVNRDWFNSLIPKIGEFTAHLIKHSKYKKFTVNDLVGRKLYLPSFGNIYLDWRPWGEFRQYLRKINIIEHDFDYYEKKSRFTRQYSVSRNDTLFYVEFVFDKVPRKGGMEVWFD